MGSQGQLVKARSLIELAGRIDPDNESVTEVRALLAYLAGDDKQARRHAEKLLADDPEASGAHLLRGLVLAEQGRLGAARAHFETAATYDPADKSIVDAAHEARWATHPLLLPLYPIDRFGAGPVWIAGVALLAVTWAIGNSTLQVVVTVAWLCFVAYSWVAPPLVRRWYERRYR